MRTFLGVLINGCVPGVPQSPLPKEKLSQKADPGFHSYLRGIYLYIPVIPPLKLKKIHYLGMCANLWYFFSSKEKKSGKGLRYSYFFCF